MGKLPVQQNRANRHKKQQKPQRCCLSFDAFPGERSIDKTDMPWGQRGQEPNLIGAELAKSSAALKECVCRGGFRFYENNQNFQ
jgi:hypothetical protein